jgi:diacylglycerol O-acyltransferase
MKVHHSLTDGVGGIDLAAHVVDAHRRPADLGPMPDVPEGAGPPTMGRLGEALGFDLGRWWRASVGVASATPSFAARLLRDPRGTAASAVATAASIARFVRPVVSTRSPVMRGRRLQCTLGRLDVPLDELRAAAVAAGGSLNDAFLAAVTGGLRRYHEQHEAMAPTLRVTMPINVRRPGDPAGGNRITLTRFEVPVAEPDPRIRMHVIHEACAAMRHERALPYSEQVAGVLNLLPPAVTGGMLKHVDFLASNVPGFPTPVYVGGARVEAFYAFGPTIGASANVTLMSYRGTCHVGVTMDTGAVPDPDAFLGCLRDGFDEVLASAPGPAAAGRPATCAAGR